MWNKAEDSLPKLKNKKDSIPVFVILETTSELGTAYSFSVASYEWNSQYLPDLNIFSSKLKRCFRIEAGDQFFAFFEPDYHLGNDNYNTDNTIVYWMLRSDLELPEGIILEE